MITRFKVNAGLETYEHEKESTNIKAVALRTFQDLATFYWCAWAAAVVTLMIENIPRTTTESVESLLPNPARFGLLVFYVSRRNVVSFMCRCYFSSLIASDDLTRNFSLRQSLLQTIQLLGCRRTRALEAPEKGRELPEGPRATGRGEYRIMSAPAKSETTFDLGESRRQRNSVRCPRSASSVSI